MTDPIVEAAHAATEAHAQQLRDLRAIHAEKKAREQEPQPAPQPEARGAE